MQTELEKSLSDDSVFNAINKMFITLQDDEVKRNNVYLNQVIKTLIEEMKSEDSLFKKTYEKIIFCGSFYKGTKVGHPNEFDLNIILKLPVKYNLINFRVIKPAFTEIHIKNDLCIFDTPKYDLSSKEMKVFNKFVCNNLLNPDIFRQWIESVITKVICKLSKAQYGCNLIVKNESSFIATISVKKSGPAFTLILNIPQENDIHIDLAPALAFNINSLVKSNMQLAELQNYQNKTWYAIPLPLANNGINRTVDTCWRLSFCDQERELLLKYGRLKPVIRQMKKLRDTQNWKNLASYFIETVCLNNLINLEGNENRIPLTLLFYEMLKELRCACETRKIPYIWDKRHNLLEKISNIELYNIQSRLNNIIRDIEKYAKINKFILAEYILNEDELQLLKMKFQNGSVNLEEIDTKENNTC